MPPSRPTAAHHLSRRSPLDHTLPMVSSLCDRSAQSISKLQSSQLNTRSSLVAACYRPAGISSGKYKIACVPSLPCSEALAVPSGYIGKATTAGAHAVAPHSAHMLTSNCAWIGIRNEHPVSDATASFQLTPSGATAQPIAACIRDIAPGPRSSNPTSLNNVDHAFEAPR